MTDDNRTSTHMHPRIAELIEYVDAQTADLRVAYDAIPPDQRGTRPAAGRWSAAEIIHHLAIVERRIAQRLSTLIEEARALPPETETTSVLGADLTARALNRTRRFVTSETSEPRDTDPAQAWGDFMAARRDLMNVIATGDGLALGGVSAPHPALGMFSAYDWIAFTGAHVARHADQMRENAL
jgi:uncharacterized damage-inducible protein DinB